MNILIIGEFSGFAKHLKNGFLQLGHDVTIVQTGDGFKRLANPDDIVYGNRTWMIGKYPVHGSNRLLALFANYRLHKEINERCPNPDLIIVINYVFIRKNFTSVGVSRRFLVRSIKKGAKLIMSECGGGMAGRYCHREFYDMIGRQTRQLEDNRYIFLLENANVIIPTAYGYYSDIINYANLHPYDTSKVINSIPLPITIDKDFNVIPCQNRKIIIFHGIIRPKKKGTPYIQAAMDKIQKEYPDKVECICKGGMPYDEYVKVFDRIDILVDQCNILEVGWGVNATIGAMKGKCVLVSCGDKNQEHMGISEIPFVPIKTDINQIYEVLKDLVTHPQKIDELKLSGRKFAEKYCECSVVAKKYLESIGIN